MTAQTVKRFVVSRVIAAPASDVFAILADPARHQETEPGDWVRDAVAPEPITAIGQVFAINMYLEALGGRYVMHNLVSEFDPDRRIAWVPGQLTESGSHDPGGWYWRYELRPQGSGTEVTLTYDWSGIPDRERSVRIPPFPPEFLDESLAALELAVLGGA
ncbi:SRPBCC domain-containing protein [Williamsia maris]|uniref:Activator of Hsp90 ATPase homolog 1-like protein n=1 Tax=Williamsia maris TaxID=72806 RepID=A0ABT1HGV4_9NOCA|nr:SRPBCC domain-containing protein [Williamsia maris]MCP2177107.1 Activator of Hsp90 ATPase homolog 1-like protein [Williamsia maris]